MNFNNVKFFGSYALTSQLPKSFEPEIAIAGKSNVGKSSLINTIFSNSKLARVSSKPGKTVTINFYRGEGFYVADLPGYGYSKSSNSEKARFSALTNDYFITGRNIVLTLLLVDIRRDFAENELTMLDFLKKNGLKFCVVLTKSDKLNKSQTAERLAYFNAFLKPESVELAVTSSLKKDGINNLRNIINISLEENND